jgi:tetraprenyl-beta-curcumene synthase
VERELGRWSDLARRIPDAALRHDALASIRAKRFHVHGGSVYALLAARPAATVRFVVAWQTLVDYLDNLLDGEGKGAGRDARRLHRTLPAALGAAPPPTDPYRWHGAGEGHYLPALVEATCRAVAALPAADAFRRQAVPLARAYAALQAAKHLPSGRGRALARLARLGPAALLPTERLAGMGSTLGLFALYATATGGVAEAPPALAELSAFHILLDYLIDRHEDRRAGAWNFLTGYPSLALGVRRMAELGEAARRAAARHPRADVHTLVVDGLAALYLTDPKARGDGAAADLHRDLAVRLGRPYRTLRRLVALARRGPLRHL